MTFLENNMRVKLQAMVNTVVKTAKDTASMQGIVIDLENKYKDLMEHKAGL